MYIFRQFKILFLGLVIFSVFGFGQFAMASDVILNDLSGQPVNIASFKGKPVILFFWTTWCPYCRGELKNLNQQYAQITKEGIVVLAVNVQESEYKVKRFFAGYTLNFKVLLDKSGLLSNDYDLLGVPTFIFLDQSGRVISRVNRLPLDYKSLLFNIGVKK